MDSRSLGIIVAQYVFSPGRVRDAGAVGPVLGTFACLACLACLGLAGCGQVVAVDGDAGSQPPAAGDAGPRLDAGPGEPTPGTGRDDASLASLVVSAPAPLTPAFEPGTTAYSMSVSMLVQEVTIAAIPAHPEATLTIDGVSLAPGQASEPIVLGLGATQARIRVTAPAGAVQDYTLAIERAADIAQFAYSKASNPGADDRFGTRLAMWGDLLAVSAPQEDSRERGAHDAGSGNQGDNSAQGSGAVYVFRRTDEGWMQEAFLKASNTDDNDAFGAGLALWGDTLAVSADREASSDTGPHGAEDGDQDDDSAPGSGAVYMFRRTSNGWVQEAYLKASNTDEGDDFGESLALWGDTLAVGAEDEAGGATGAHGPDGGNQGDDSAPDSGAVYVFRRTDNGWAQEAYIKASNTGARDNFGAVVALWGDTLAVGAPDEDSAERGVHGPRAGDQDDDSAQDSGAVYVFRRTGSTWDHEAYLKASNTGEGDGFGHALALWGNVLAVGAPGEDSADTGVHDGDEGNQDDDSAGNSGAVYLFRHGGGTWAQEAFVKASNSEAGDELGTAVALWRDLLVVGANGEDSAAAGAHAGGGGGAARNNDAQGSGALYLFRRVDDTWAQDGYFKTSNPGPDDALSEDSALALPGNSPAVGAPQEDSNATSVHDTRHGRDTGNPTGSPSDNSARDSGAVYIFH